jgi:hypothetical protein
LSGPLSVSKLQTGATAGAVLAEDELLRHDPPDPRFDINKTPQRLTRVFTDDRPETMDYLAELPWSAQLERMQRSGCSNTG